jgi:segregation and condensation protein B
MSQNTLSKADILEAIFFASEAPLPLEKIAQILEVAPTVAAEELEILREEKARIGGLQVVEVAGGWQMLTKAEVAPFVAKLREAPRQKLSRAAFEVLAVVAYRQPITRAEIEELRGVDCSRPLTFLLDKKLLQFAGRKEAPGRPWLYETSPQFLEHFGLRSIADLPPLSELAELNEAALESHAQQLFSRGPMQVEAEVNGAEPNEAADENNEATNEAINAETDDADEDAS